MGRNKASVELFETIRREYEFGVGSVQGVARKLGVHRRLVREAVGSAVPAPRKRPERPRPVIGPLVELIDGILLADRKAPRKQRHTAHRIFVRIRQERPECVVAEASIRRYVRQRKAALGLLTRETFVPQAYDWGVEAQVEGACRPRRGAAAVPGLQHAEHGQWRRLPPRVPARDAASILGGA